MQEIETLIKLKIDKNLSYEKLARQIGVSFQTVLRWINKGDKPSDLALAQIRRFIKENEDEVIQNN